MKVLSAEDILKAEDRKIETVPVPEWGGEVLVREMSGLERDRFDISVRDANDNLNLQNYRARLVAACACDAAGKLLFTPFQAQDLGQKSSLILMRIFRVAQKLNGMSQEAVADAKKDSSETASGASPSDSPSPSASGT